MIVNCSCQNCGGTIEFEAEQAGTVVKCPHCKTETAVFLGVAKPDLPTPKLPKSTTPPARTKILLIVGVGLAAIVFCILCVVCFSARTGIRVPESMNDRATALALDVVSNSLVAPLTAKFSQINCVEKIDSTFLVTGKVDSQNSFGAMLRKDFGCAITNNGDGNLLWVVLHVGGDAQMNPAFKIEDVQLVSSQIVTSRDETSLQPDEHKYKKVSGVVKNLTKHELNLVSITYNLYTSDADAVYVSQASALINNPLEAGQTEPFDTDLFDYKLTPKFDSITASP